jgi:hypothetical protein
MAECKKNVEVKMLTKINKSFEISEVTNSVAQRQTDILSLQTNVLVQLLHYVCLRSGFDDKR